MRLWLMLVSVRIVHRGGRWGRVGRRKAHTHLLRVVLTVFLVVVVAVVIEPRFAAVSRQGMRLLVLALMIRVIILRDAVFRLGRFDAGDDRAGGFHAQYDSFQSIFVTP